MKKLILALAMGIAMESNAGQNIELYVNTLPTHYAVEKNRVDGEFDAIRLANDAKLEEAWVYIKENENEIWYECGVEEDEGQVLFEKECLENILEKHENIEKISFYHVHPIIEGENDLSQFPSKNDFITDLKILEWIYNARPEIIDKVDMRTVVSSGVYCVKYSPKILLDSNEKFRHYEHIDEMFKKRLNFGSEKPLSFDFSQKNRKYFADECKKFADRFSTGTMDIQFEGK